MKISIIGAGNIGTQIAQHLVSSNYEEIVLVDIAKDKTQGMVLDLKHTRYCLRSNSEILAGDYKDIYGSDVVVITAGLPRKPGMTRDDLFIKNKGIMETIVPQIKENAPNTVIIVVTNPLDKMVEVVHELSGFTPERVIGMSSLLDTSRFVSIIKDETGADIDEIEARVIGPHNDEMNVLTESASVAGHPLSLDHSSVIEKVKNSGKEIVSHLGNGSAFFAPAICVFHMIEAIVNDKGEVIPCCVYGSDGYKGRAVTLGKRGVLENLDG